MIGFLRKDFYTMAALYRKNLLLVLALYTAMTLVMHVTFLLYMLVWMMGFYGLSASTVDDSCGWDRYARTLPASAWQAVGARFVMTLGMMVLAALFGVVIGFLNSRIHGDDYAETLLMLGIVSSAALLFMGPLLAGAYKWGVEKVRNGFFVLFMAACLLPPALSRVGITGGNALQGLTRWLDRQAPAVLVALLLAAALAVCFLSYLAACRIYRRKEF